jgi:hypothetical protein
MSDTPKTDANKYPADTFCGSGSKTPVVHVDFARKMERELQHLRDQLDAWREVAGMLASSLQAGAASVHPSAYHFRGTALEAYDRLKSNGTDPH